MKYNEKSTIQIKVSPSERVTPSHFLTTETIGLRALTEQETPIRESTSHMTHPSITGFLDNSHLRRILVHSLIRHRPVKVIILIIYI